jgi:hypothetical protein
MSMFERLRDWLLAPLLSNDSGFMRQMATIDRARNYRQGRHDRQMKVKENQFDDNLAVNFTGLIVDRSVNMLMRGLKFDMGEDANQKYIDGLWAANKKSILLYKTGVLGAEAGTCYLKIIPEGVAGRDGVVYPRLVAIDPEWIEIETSPEDIEDVTGYEIKYVITGADGKPVAIKEEIEVDKGIEINEQSEQVSARPQAWNVTRWESTQGGRWQRVSQYRWEYAFAPLLHWQNLPDPLNVYGDPDITLDIEALQDRINFVASNISKIIRLYAHPPRWGKHLGDKAVMTWGPDEMPVYNDERAELNQLEPIGDLAASTNFLTFLTKALNEISQTVDVYSQADKLGQLTNFAVRVLYQDALNKLEAKRDLYGEALVELNRRLLVVGQGVETDGGKVVWGDPLPKNEIEEQTALKGDLDMGIVSKETVSGLRGYNWEDEQARKSTEQVEGDNVGAALLRAFNNGQQ